MASLNGTESRLRACSRLGVVNLLRWRSVTKMQFRDAHFNMGMSDVGRRVGCAQYRHIGLALEIKIQTESGNEPTSL